MQMEKQDRLIWQINRNEITYWLFCYFFSNIVLSSPEKRTIYDVYGQKGLDAGWEVGIICSTVDIVHTKQTGGFPNWSYNMRDKF